MLRGFSRGRKTNLAGRGHSQRLTSTASKLVTIMALVAMGGNGIAKLQAYTSLKTFAPATNQSCPAFRVG
jgi:hypothetical protein